MALGKHALIDPSLSRVVRLVDLQRSLPTSVILRFCDSFKYTPSAQALYIQT